MKVQVLIAAMNQTSHALLDKMNIQTDAIVGNQCERNEIEDFVWKQHNIKYLSFAERGVGLNRNNSLMRADADICIFADDDMVYVDGYADLITRAFEQKKDADVIIFDIIGRKPTNKIKRVRFYNYLRYGTARVAIRLKSIKKNGIYFNQCFGGGTEHCHGEDNLFLASCLGKRLKIYAFPLLLAELRDERSSTWDTGDIECYLRDQGILYRTISRKWWRLLCLQDAVRRKSFYKKPWYSSFKTMVNSAKSYNDV